MKKLIMLTCLFFVCSCAQKSIERRLTNKSWTITKVKYQGRNYGLFFFRWNCISFKSQNQCDLPYFYGPIKNSKWFFSSHEGIENFRIRITGSEDKFLDNEYNCTFMDNEQYLDVLILKSDSLTLFCTSEK
jgi:hypothetical protein